MRPRSSWYPWSGSAFATAGGTGRETRPLPPHQRAAGARSSLAAPTQPARFFLCSAENLHPRMIMRTVLLLLLLLLLLGALPRWGYSRSWGYGPSGLLGLLLILLVLLAVMGRL